MSECKLSCLEKNWFQYVIIERVFILLKNSFGHAHFHIRICISNLNKGDHTNEIYQWKDIKLAIHIEGNVKLYWERLIQIIKSNYVNKGWNLTKDTFNMWVAQIVWEYTYKSIVSNKEKGWYINFPKRMSMRLWNQKCLHRFPSRKHFQYERV